MSISVCSAVMYQGDQALCHLNSSGDDASTSGSWLTICSAMNTAWQYSARVSSSATL
ncbi:hypothetical protein D3C72_2599270 [compost metagenome]